MSLWSGRHHASTVDEQLVSNLVCPTRHGGVDEAGSLEIFMIVFHVLRLLGVMLVGVMISSHFFFSSIMLFYTCVTSLYSPVVKRVACILFL